MMNGREEGSYAERVARSIEANLHLKKEHVDKARFEQWFPRLKRHTIRSTVIELPTAAVQYLRDGGSVAMGEEQFPVQWGRRGDAVEDVTDDGTPSELAEDAIHQNDSLMMPEFDELNREVERVIAEYGGEVLPKLSWTCPRDASWISVSGNAKCTTASEVFLLLKSSDFVNYDLHHAYDQCVDVRADEHTDWTLCLVLRKWFPLRTAMEFRCFVAENALVGISQRYDREFYKFLVEQREELEGLIREFWEENIRECLELKDYVLDVYVRTTPTRKVYVIDINPFSLRTDSLLFSWYELELARAQLRDAVVSEEAVYLGTRLVHEEVHVQPSVGHQYGKPMEAIDIATPEGMEALQRLQELQCRDEVQ